MRNVYRICYVIRILAQGTEFAFCIQRATDRDIHLSTAQAEVALY